MNSNKGVTTGEWALETGGPTAVALRGAKVASTLTVNGQPGGVLERSVFDSVQSIPLEVDMKGRTAKRLFLFVRMTDPREELLIGRIYSSPTPQSSFSLDLSKAECLPWFPSLPANIRVHQVTFEVIVFFDEPEQIYAHFGLVSLPS